MTETFSQFKQKFYERVPQPAVFDCEEYNLLKVVLDGLKVDYQERGIYNQAIFEQGLKNGLAMAARRFKYRPQIQQARQRAKTVAATLRVPYFFFDNGRVAETEKGEKVSFYFNKVENYLGADKCVTIYQTKTELKKGASINDLFLATLFNAYNKQEKAMIKQLIAAYNRLLALKIFSGKELFNIRVAINKFFDEYRFWNYMLKDATVQAALFDEHYHREGFILALKRKSISVVEVQHGLIAPEDVFYVFPEPVKAVAARALFPDKMFTYGKYWSNVLKKGFEFEASQIDELGVYQELNKYVSPAQEKELNAFVGHQPFILVTTQTFLHEYFIEYISWLSADLLAHNSDIKIVVKLHPSEKVADYKALEGLSNVRLFAMNTEYLLSRCSWHVSCYSTTLYDATKYSCENFSLNIDSSKDYIDTFIKEGISELIHKNQNPFLENAQRRNHAAFDKATLYEDFNEHKHKLKAIVK